MLRIFRNCRTYNEKSSDYDKYANAVERFFINKMKEVGAMVDMTWLSIQFVFISVIIVKVFGTISVIHIFFTGLMDTKYSDGIFVIPSFYRGKDKLC